MLSEKVKLNKIDQLTCWAESGSARTSTPCPAGALIRVGEVENCPVLVSVPYGTKKIDWGDQCKYIMSPLRDKMQGLMDGTLECSNDAECANSVTSSTCRHNVCTQTGSLTTGGPLSEEQRILQPRWEECRDLLCGNGQGQQQCSVNCTNCSSHPATPGV